MVEHALLDHLVRPQQNRLRDREAERLRGLEVEDKLEFRGLLDWQIGGPSSAEDLYQVCYCSAMAVALRAILFQTDALPMLTDLD